MWSSDIEQLKGLGISDQEVAQVVKLKHAGISDDTCVEWSPPRAFTSTFSQAAIPLRTTAAAGFIEPQILRSRAPTSLTLSA
jgi:hypothetical protein